MKISVEEQKKMFEEHLRLQGKVLPYTRKTERKKDGDQAAGRAGEEKPIRTHVAYPKNIQVQRLTYPICNLDVE